MKRDDITQDIKDTVTRVVDTARKSGRAALKEIRSQAAEAASVACDEAGLHIGAATASLASGGQRLAQSLRNAAAENSGDSLQHQVLDAVAEGVAAVSQSLRGRSLASLLSEMQGFARRNPGTFIAGVAVAGFAIGHFSGLLPSDTRADAAAPPDKTTAAPRRNRSAQAMTGAALTEGRP